MRHVHGLGRLVLLLTSGVLGITGCSKSESDVETVPVSGQVLYRGKPVEGAKVIFTSGKDVPPAVGITGKDGRFQLTTRDSDPGGGAVPGICNVTVSKDMQVGSAGPVNETMEAAEKRLRKEKRAGAEKFASVIPDRYADPATSTLQFTVEKGKPNDFKIELKD